MVFGNKRKLQTLPETYNELRFPKQFGKISQHAYQDETRECQSIRQEDHGKDVYNIATKHLPREAIMQLTQIYNTVIKTGYIPTASLCSQTRQNLLIFIYSYYIDSLFSYLCKICTMILPQSTYIFSPADVTNVAEIGVGKNLVATIMEATHTKISYIQQNVKLFWKSMTDLNVNNL